MAGTPGGPGSSGSGSGAAGPAAGLLAAFLLVLPLLLVVVVGAGAAGSPPAGCGPGGTATTAGGVALDAEQMGNAQLIVTVTARRSLPAYAAVVAVAAAYTEAKLRNDLVQRDADSVGLFRVRVGLHGQPVAQDPARSTGWFLERLVQVPGWQSLPLTRAAAAVQKPDARYAGRYAAAQPLASAVVAQLWPTARAGAAPATATAARTAGTGATSAFAPGNSPDRPRNAGTARSAGSTAGAGPAGVLGPDGGGVFPEPPEVCPAGGLGGGAGATRAGGGPATETIPCAVGGGKVVQAPGGVRIRVCTVGPWTVDTTIAPPVAALLAAATAAGLELGGGSYRSHAEQIATRRANCGPSQYDLFAKPASACSPPTARPGQSQHEWAQALDVTSSGALIRSHSDPAWQWLDAHAGAYGLRNLPSEPWHWSRNGR